MTTPRTTPATPSATPAAQIRAALASGRAAAINQQPVSTNPYRGDADTARERVLARMWIRGYGAGNPMRIDNSD